MSSLDYQLYVHDEESWRGICDCDFLIDEPAEVREYDNAIVEPLRYIPGTRELYGDGLLEGGLCSCDFEFLAGLHRSADGRKVNRSCLASYVLSDEELKTSDETVIFGGLVTSHFGHMLCDGMTRLWYPASHPEDTTKVVFLVYPNQTFPYWELLELAGIDRERVEIVTEPTRFSHVIVPDETSFSFGKVGYKKEWKLVLERIRSSVEPAPYTKVYFTRRQLKGQGGCVGEDYFEDFFRANGFHIVAPESLPFREQIALIAGADEFVCTMGTIAHQIMFARPGTHQVVLNRSILPVRAAPLMNHASGTSLTLVDAYKNVLPEQQGGNSVWLLAPTSHWQVFLQTCAEYDSTDMPPYPLEMNLLLYLRKWGKRYEQDPGAYHWICSENVVDVIARINLHLRDTEIDKKAYSAPLAVERLRKELYRLEQKAGQVQEVDLQLDGDELVVSGSTPLPLSDPDGLVIQLRLCAEGDGRDAADDFEILAVVTGDDEGTITWCARLRLKDLREAVQNENAGSCWRLSLEISVGDRSIAPRLVPVEDARQRVFLSDSLPQGTALRPTFDEEQNLQLALVSYEDLLADVEASYQIHDLYWKDGTLHMRGVLDHPLCEAAGFSCRLVCVREDDQQTVSYPLTCTRSSQPHHLVWSTEIDPSRLVKGFRNAGTEAWALNLDLSIGGVSCSIPFGRKRPVGMFARYCQHLSECQDVCVLPVQDSERTLGFELVSREELPQRPLVNRIETLVWTENVLNLSGCTEHPLLQVEPDKLFVRLRSKTGWHFDVPVRWSYDCDTNMCRWEIELDPQEIITELPHSGTEDSFRCFFTVFVKSENFKLKGPLGKYRPPNTLAAYKSCVVTAGGFRLVPIQNREKRLGFTIEAIQSNDSVRKIAE